MTAKIFNIYLKKKNYSQINAFGIQPQIQIYFVYNVQNNNIKFVWDTKILQLH